MRAQRRREMGHRERPEQQRSELGAAQGRASVDPPDRIGRRLVRRSPRRPHCYLIQKSSLAGPDARAFLERCLRSGPPSLQGRALRAFGKLHDAEIEQWLRPLCEQIVSGDADRIDAARMRTTQDEVSKPALHRAALETLRDVGDAEVDRDRQARTQPQSWRPRASATQFPGGGRDVLAPDRRPRQRNLFLGTAPERVERQGGSIMPYQKIPDLGIEYALIHFDDNGRERTDDPEGGVFSRTLLEKARRDKPTHIFLFSHGWKGDVPVGDRSVQPLDRRDVEARGRPDGDGARLPAAVHRPALAEPAVGRGRRSAPASFGTPARRRLDALLDAAVAHFGGSDAVRAPLEVIFARLREGPGARVLPDEVVAAYGELAEAIGFSAGKAAPTRRRTRKARRSIRRRRSAPSGSRAPASRSASPARSGTACSPGLRQASFWLMKHRARTVGEQGMHQFVGDLQQRVRRQRAPDGPQLRLHRGLVDPRRTRRNGCAAAPGQFRGPRAGGDVALVVRRGRSRQPTSPATSAVS